MDERDIPDLLFFETFTHDATQGVNLDLIQFPSAVCVEEVRVVPLGTKVEVDVRGGERLGATNPSQFKLDLFVNNMARRSAASFVKLGILDYKENENIQLIPENKIATDGIVLRGCYTTITLAVYGSLTTVAREPTPPPPTAPAMQAGRKPQPGLGDSSLESGGSAAPTKWEGDLFQRPKEPPAPEGTIDDPSEAFATYLKKKDAEKAEKLAREAARKQKSRSSRSHSPDYYKRERSSEARSPSRGRSPDSGRRRSSRSPGWRSPDSRRRSRTPEARRRSRTPDSRTRRSRTPDSRRRSRTPDSRRRSRTPDSRRRSRTPEGWGRSRTPERRPRSRSADRHRSISQEHGRSMERRRSPDDYGRHSPDHPRRSRSMDRRRLSRSPDHRRMSRSPDRARRSSRSLDRRTRSPEHHHPRSPGGHSMRGRTPEHVRARSPSGGHGRSPDRRPRSRSPMDHMPRGRTPPDHMPRGRSPPDHMRGRSPPDHMRGRSPPDHMRGRSPPDHMRGRSPPDHIRGRSPPDHMRGRSPPDHMRGRSPPDHMRGRSPPDHMRGRSPPDHMRGRSPPDRMRSPGRRRSPGRGGRDEPWQPPPPMPPHGEERKIETLGSRGMDLHRLEMDNLPPPPHRMDQPPPNLPGPTGNFLPPPMPPQQQQQQQRNMGPPHMMPRTDIPPPNMPLNQQLPIRAMHDNRGGPMQPPGPMHDDAANEFDQEHLGPGEGGEMYRLSDGEIQDADAYSEISSDENFPDSQEIDLEQMEVPTPLLYAVMPFSPYNLEVTKPQTFNDPALTAYEVAAAEAEKKQETEDEDEEPPMPQEARDLLAMVEKFSASGQPHHAAWIEAAEKVPGLLETGLRYLLTQKDRTDVLSVLISWCEEGLSVDKAMAQPETAYKVRHLKMGIRLAAALSSCDNALTRTVLAAADLQHRLMDLHESPSMSSSLKLQIVRALDQTTRLHAGLHGFLGVPHGGDGGDGDGAPHNTPSPYQRAQEILLSKQMARVAEAWSKLIKKIHVYEVLGQIYTTTQMLVDGPLPEAPAAGPNEEEDGGEPPLEPLLPPNLSERDLDLLAIYLDEVTRVLADAVHIMGQPKKTFPTRVQFDVQNPPCDPYPDLYAMLTASHFLETLFILLSSPVTCNHNNIFQSLHNVLMQFMGTWNGLVFLASRHDLTNQIIACLEQKASYVEEEVRAEHPADWLAARLSSHLQVMQHIDTLSALHQKEGKKAKLEVDCAQGIAVLHALNSMVFHPQGKQAVVDVFAMEDNLKYLLPFIRMSEKPEESVLVKRSVSYGYAVMLILKVTRHSESQEWLAKFASTLIAFTEFDTSSASSKIVSLIHELADWLAPYKSIPALTYEPDTVSGLARLLKQYVEEPPPVLLPKGLTTVLRMLRTLCIAPDSTAAGGTSERVVLLKYKWALIEVFSNDCMPLLVSTLQRVSDLLLVPLQRGIPQPSFRHAQIVSVIKSALALMQAILADLIATRGKEFRDLSAIPCLLSLHTVMCSVSHTGSLGEEPQAIQNTIVDTLMTFTQPAMGADKSEQSLGESLWSQMMKEVLQYTLSSPHTFLSGLILTSEMLPLPLPIQTKDVLSEEEVEVAVNHRKLWSAHLHPLSADIQQLIHQLAGSSCQPLQQLLRRVCWQLADLAAPTALTVVRCLLDTLVDSLDSSKKEWLANQKSDAANPPTPPAEVPASGNTARILNLLGFLTTQPPIKAALIHLTSKSGSKSDEEKYGGILQRLSTLLNVSADDPAPAPAPPATPGPPPHVQAQVFIVAIFQPLCDIDVTLVTGVAREEAGGEGLELSAIMANALLSREPLRQLSVGLMRHIHQQEHSLSSVLPALRTLSMLIYHDYGYYHVKSAMDAVPSAFNNLFTTINNTFSKESSDCIATLCSATDFIKYMVSPPDGAATHRRHRLPVAELKALLNWTSPDPGGHPLADLDALLQEFAKEEETLRAAYQSVHGIYELLQSPEQKDAADANPPPPLEEVSLEAAPFSLQQQFSYRAPFLHVEEEDDQLSSVYWLATPMGEESEHELDMANVNFEEMITQFCPDFDIKSELEKGVMPSDPAILRHRQRKQGRRNIHDTINTSKMRGNSRGFVAPMRGGRGFGGGRGMSTMAMTRHDNFRSRPPNTSRPPSMHVDDYMKMELENAGMPSVGPTGMNPELTKYRQRLWDEKNSSPGAAGPGGGGGGGGSGYDTGGIPGGNMSGPGRGGVGGGGRGFDRGRGGGIGNRGRFFSPPSNFPPRRDPVGGGGPTYGGGGGGGGGYPRGGGASMRGATGPPRMYAMRGSPPKALGGGGGGAWGGGQRLPPGVGAVTAVSRQQPMYGGGARGFQGRGAGGRDDMMDRDRRGGGGRDMGARFMPGAPTNPYTRDLDQRFMTPPAGQPMYGRRDYSSNNARHQRTFTK